MKIGRIAKLRKCSVQPPATRTETTRPRSRPTDDDRRLLPKWMQLFPSNIMLVGAACGGSANLLITRTGTLSSLGAERAREGVCEFELEFFVSCCLKYLRMCEILTAGWRSKLPYFGLLLCLQKNPKKYKKTGRFKKSVKDKFKQNNVNRTMWIFKQTVHLFHVSECLH